jgi:hypothetical protein
MKTNVIDCSEGAGVASPDRGPELGDAIVANGRFMKASDDTDAPVASNSALPQTPPPSLVKSLGRNANLDSLGDSLGRKSPAERSNELITASHHMTAAPMHFPGHLPYLQSTVSWIPTSFPQEKWDGQELLDDREILNKYTMIASQTSDELQTAELRNRISHFESHAHRRHDLMKANPIPVFHHPDMEALSTDDMVEISFMADIFFAAHAWEYSYRLYSLLIDSWNIKRVGIGHPGRVRSAIKLAQAALTQSQCASAIRLLEEILAGYQEWFIDAELHLLNSHLSDVLRKSGNTQNAQQHMESVSIIVPFNPGREHQSALIAPDLRVACSLVQEHASQLAVPDATGRFLAAISLRESRRSSTQEALRPLLRWCVVVLEDHVNTQSGSTTWSPNEIGESNTIYPLSDDTDRRSRQFTLVFCRLWRALEEERGERYRPGRVCEVVQNPTSLSDCTEVIRQQTYIPIPSIVSAIASMAVPLHSQAPTGSPSQISSSELYKQAQAYLLMLLRLTDSEIESLFLKTHANSTTLDVDAKRVTNPIPHSSNGFVKDFVRRHVWINLSHYGFQKVAKALDINCTDALGVENYYGRWLQKHKSCFLLSSPGASNLSGLASMESLADRIRAIAEPKAADFEEVGTQPGSQPMQRSSLSWGLMWHTVRYA